MPEPLILEIENHEDDDPGHSTLTLHGDTELVEAAAQFLITTIAAGAAAAIEPGSDGDLETAA